MCEARHACMSSGMGKEALVMSTRMDESSRVIEGEECV